MYFEGTLSKILHLPAYDCGCSRGPLPVLNLNRTANVVVDLPMFFDSCLRPANKVGSQNKSDSRQQHSQALWLLIALNHKAKAVMIGWSREEAQ